MEPTVAGAEYMTTLSMLGLHLDFPLLLAVHEYLDSLSDSFVWVAFMILPLVMPQIVEDIVEERGLYRNGVNLSGLAWLVLFVLVYALLITCALTEKGLREQPQAQ